MLPLRRFAVAATLAALGAAPMSPLVAQSGTQLDASRTGDPVPLLLRRDAPLPSTAANPPFDPTDPSTALAFDFTQGGVNFNGIGQLITPLGGGFAAFCTAQRVGPRTVLTAAHCVTQDATGALLPGAQPGGGAFVRFLAPGSTTSARVFENFVAQSVQVRPDWFGFGNPLTQLKHDMAVVTFATDLPAWVTTYGLYAGSNPFRVPSLHVGYGTYGTGTGATNFDSRRRWGTNDVEWIPNDATYFGDDMFHIDFDNGSPIFDVFCLALGVCNEGLLTEAGIAQGDSGGSLFVGGRVAGVASFGSFFCANAACAPYVADPTRPFDSFGAFMGFAPISENLDFLASANVIPEPSTIVLTGGGLMLLLGAAARRRRV
jgi:hypothetical protein